MDSNDRTIPIDLVEEFSENDSWAALHACITSVLENIDGPLTRDVFCLVDRRSLPAKSRFRCGRMIRLVNNFRTSPDTFKARYVVQGHRDAE